jgi:uncharacterized protein DUF3551
LKVTEHQEPDLKKLAFALGIFAVTAGFGMRAEAQNYPWCATYSMGTGGSQNCGFSSFEQCLDDVRGIGGFCDRNTQYVPPAGASSSQTRRKPQRPS